MSYQVLARKYRSQSFDQLIGQNHISQTLLNALKNNRLPHALLFTGLRGTGKTSSARILAKSIRCTNAKDFVPCNTCDNCVAITAGNSVDVIEIDGASNNGVDAIRDLRESVMFMPSSGKYKIIIIDEVHMLSTSAFNALLKTLEEPPAHVIFMMATTEAHKIPQTILSRCQRFDFRRISVKQLTEHLKHICKLENIQADEKALWQIAQQGDGSARDSITLLDQVINFSKGELSEKTVTEILGLTDRSLIFEVFENLVHRKPEKIVDSLEKLATVATNPSLFLEEIIRLLRHALLMKSNTNNTTLSIDLPTEEIEILKNLTQNLSDADLHMLFDMCLKSMSDLSRSHDPILVMEMALLRMAQAPLIFDIQKLLKNEGGSPPHPKPKEEIVSRQTITPPQKASIQVPAPALNPTTQPVVSEAPPTPRAPSVPSTENLVEFVQFVKKAEPFLGAKLDNIAIAGVKEQRIHFEVKESFGFLADQLMQSDTSKKLQGFIDSFYGVGYAFQVLKTKSAKISSAAASVSQNLNGNITAPAPVAKSHEPKTAHAISAQKEIDAENKLMDSWMKDSRIQKAQSVFNAKLKVISKN
jgi:DNA polymerase-3 subunit gamma/tau